MAEATWNGQRLVSTPRSMTPGRRADLENGRWYNTSLDDAMAELERVESRVARAVSVLGNARCHAGIEGKMVEDLMEILSGKEEAGE